MMNTLNLDPGTYIAACSLRFVAILMLLNLLMSDHCRLELACRKFDHTPSGGYIISRAVAITQRRNDEE